MTQLSTADVVIVGAGPAGAAAAIALRNAGGGSVILLDDKGFSQKNSEPRFHYGESANPSVRLQLALLGLRTDLETLGHMVCRGSCSVWGEDSLAYKDFHTMHHGYGWHLDRATFDSWLIEQALEKGASIQKGVRLNNITPLQLQVGREKWQLNLSNGDHIRTAFVIDATGRKAFVASKLGAKCHHLDRLVAVALTLNDSGSALLQHRSLVESVSDGWWYATAIPQGRSVVMFMSDSDLLRDLDVSNRAGFIAHLSQTSYISKHINLESLQAFDSPKPDIVGAISQYTDPPIGDDWMAIGDAAIGLDPLTSSGISSALEDGFVAAQAIVAKNAGNNEPMAMFSNRIAQAWQTYQHQRRTYYQHEFRWAHHAFWQRRHSAEVNIPSLSLTSTEDVQHG
ncbi:Dehydrogenase (flavoprotein) [Oceanospirillum multiglobuliferum]|uniref:FAD-dependent oxidoreductase 2 FAD-binding domain-containing protein n=1 Tax=Oceanospirillum multiglobuliferum TaxID=64969 RepID=A0A1T4PYZ3_9GAMM|nr:tryptophan 7-halogenase [Oceanospirillum multiglobuliferum]OPX55443.1 hypothetical protein BTE48_08610 [Oceanospirillum multiglobuliferum]SJZ96762.1 Dehydrogenase (flavoprotein) [Oceanospirillum multiglobuliferum]